VTVTASNRHELVADLDLPCELAVRAAGGSVHQFADEIAVAFSGDRA
jgi:hypothetical protein